MIQSSLQHNQPRSAAAGFQNPLQGELPPLVDPYVVHRHELWKLGINRRAFVRTTAGDIHNQIHGSVKRPANAGVLGICQDFVLIQEKVHGRDTTPSAPEAM